MLNSQTTGAEGGKFQGAKNVVLVHGAWADGSSWSKIIPLLEAKGLHVVAVQNPLTSLVDDVATTKRAIALQDGPVLLVGHSYGGAVITEAGNDPKVIGLVYVAAFAPNDGEALVELGKEFPVPPGNAEAKPDEAGFLSLTQKGVVEDFAQDLPLSERRVMVATQGPTSINAFTQKISIAAWKTKPSWVIVSANDRMLPPEMEKANVTKLKAHGTTLPTCHLAMLEAPEKVAQVIDEAARNALSK